MKYSLTGGEYESLKTVGHKLMTRLLIHGLPPKYACCVTIEVGSKIFRVIDAMPGSTEGKLQYLRNKFFLTGDTQMLELIIDQNECPTITKWSWSDTQLSVTHGGISNFCWKGSRTLTLRYRGEMAQANFQTTKTGIDFTLKCRLASSYVPIDQGKQSTHNLL